MKDPSSNTDLSTNSNHNTNGKDWVLVTGAAGLLGSILIEQLLAQGKKVKALYHQTPLKNQRNQVNLQQVQGDILDVVTLEEMMHDVDTIYHCAGLVSFAPARRDRLYKINAEGTANIVNAALSASVKKLVHVSSVAALGRIREHEPINENMQWTPTTSNSIYGHSKYLGELEVWRGIAEGLEAVIVNPTIILGAGNWDDGSTGIFKSVYNEFPWYTEGTTGFVDVRDVCKVMILLMESPISGERFIVSAENTGYRQVFDLIADAFQKKRATRKVSTFLAALIWRLESVKSKFTGKEPLLTKETAATAMAKVNFDNNKLLKFLPVFSYTPLKETISHTCRLLQQKVNN